MLVVDDEADIRKLLRRVFEDRGYFVAEADRGLTALGLVKEHPPDCIVLDAMLPEVHGFDIAKRLKGTERYGHIPIVMVSAVYKGWRFAEDLKTSYGVNAYIEKPFRVGDVVRAVENAIDARSSRVDDEAISAEAEKMLNAGIEAYKKGDIARAVEHLSEGTRIDPARVPAALPPRSALRQTGPHLRRDPGAADGARHQRPPLPRAEEPRGALPEGWISQQSHRDLGARARRRAGRPTRQSIKEHLVGLL
jgi:CheY-like chemotaxis protein